MGHRTVLVAKRSLTKARKRQIFFQIDRRQLDKILCSKFRHIRENCLRCHNGFENTGMKENKAGG